MPHQLIGTGRTLLTPLTYADKVLALRPIAYWPMWEPSGTIAYDISGNARNGAYTGILLGQQGIGDGRTAGWLDGINDTNNVQSASLQAAFNGSQGTMMVWARANAAAMWTNGIAHGLIRAFADDNNQIAIQKTTTNNQLQWYYAAGGTAENHTSTNGAGTLSWFLAAFTWSKTADQTRAYLFINGVAAYDNIRTVLGVWAGVPTSMDVGLGGAGVVSWLGWEAHAALWARALSSAEIQALSIVG